MSQNRSIAKCIVLSIITCGIYGMYWFVVATDDVGRVTNRPGTSGGLSLVFSLITCGIYGYYWAWSMGWMAPEATTAWPPVLSPSSSCCSISLDLAWLPWPSSKMS